MKVQRAKASKINRTTIEKAWRTRQPDTRSVFPDLECRGLALVVNPTSMTWVYSFKPRGIDSHTGRRFASRSITIGNPETHSPETARTAANTYKGQIKAGLDPSRQRRTELSKAAEQRSNTVERLLAIYVGTLPTRPRLRGSGHLSAKQVRQERRNAEAGFRAAGVMQMAVSDVTVEHIKLIIGKVGHLQATARHRFGAISRFFDWAQDKGFVTLNPCNSVPKMRRPRAPAPRRRFLTLKELAQIWRTCQELPDLQRDFVQFLIAVPCRRGEASNLTWGELDLDAGIWTQYQFSTKNDDPHRFLLPKLAVTIIARRLPAGSITTSKTLVFPSPKANKPLTTFSDVKRNIDALLPGLRAWSFHDLRRSFTTALGEHGIDEALIDSILNHRQSASRGGVLGVYQQASRWPAQKAAMSVWNDLLSKAIEEHSNE